ncbi:MAG: hypothetical protein FJ087_09115, partial [Deltaproteobacteria bacterium]|nr:hypothetical protein [Deltaproteobacteria bacterium]
MRNIAFLLAILAAAPAFAGTWTSKTVPGGQGGNLLGLAGPSETKAFGIGAIKDQQGNDQMVWVRSPDGDTWSIQQMQPPSPGEMVILTDLQCASATRCFAVGMGINQQTMGFYNRFAISTDGGDTWAWPPPLMYAESRLIILDEQNIWAVGGATNGLKSSNGGNKWTFVTPRIGDDMFTALQDGSFIDLQNGWLVNGSAETDDKTGKVTAIDPKGALLRTTDAGKTWTALFRDVSELPSRVKFVP